MGNVSSLSVAGMPVLPGLNSYMTTGNVFFVDSGTGSDTGGQGWGETVDEPFATLDYAIGRCTASNGDVIILAPGHAETVTTQILMDVAGVHVIGLGLGDNRPTFTVNANIWCVYCNADDCKITNIKFATGSSTNAASEMLRVNADEFTIQGCEFDMLYDMYNMVKIAGGDNIQILDCVFKNRVLAEADAVPQSAILDKEGTSTIVKNCRFSDLQAEKGNRWRSAAVRGGKKGASGSVQDQGCLLIQDCTFLARGIATATRTAGASGFQATVNCVGISTSSNTAVGSIFTPTYQHIIETYNVAAVNKQNLLMASTSDRRLKKDIAYL